MFANAVLKVYLSTFSQLIKRMEIRHQQPANTCLNIKQNRQDMPKNTSEPHRKISISPLEH